MNEWTLGDKAVPPGGRPDQGRRAAFIERLYRDHFADLCKNIYRTFGAGPPEPEEVVQAAFAKFAGLDDPAGIEQPRSFIFITARNLVLDHRRRAKTNNAYIAEQIALDADLKLEGITPERVVLARDYFDRLVAAIRTLPRKQQIVLGLSRLEGKTYKQIQEETGWSSGDINRNMSAGMDTLMRLLETDMPLRGRAARKTRSKDGADK